MSVADRRAGPGQAWFIPARAQFLLDQGDNAVRPASQALSYLAVA